MSESFERFKFALHERIKKGTIEVDTPDGMILLKKGRRKYRVIEPPVIQQADGSLKFMKANFWFGGWGNLFKLLTTAAIIGLFIFAYYNLIGQVNTMLNKPLVRFCLYGISPNSTNITDVINYTLPFLH